MKTSFRILISVVLLALIAWKVDLPLFAQRFAGLDPRLFACAFVLVFLVQVLSAGSWLTLLRVKTAEIRFFALLRVMLMGSFFGTFLPSSSGSDVVNTLFVGRMIRGGRLDSAGSLLTVRVLGIFVLLLLALFGSFLFDTGAGGDGFLLLSGALLAGIVSAFLMIRSERIRDVLERVTAPFGGGRLIRFLQRAYGALAQYWRETAVMGRVLFLAVCIQLVRISSVYVIARSLGVGVPFHYYLVFIPMISIVLMLPVSIGGLGVREGGYIYLFSLIGVGQEAALSISLASFVMHLLLAVLGGTIYLFAGAPAAQGKN